MIFSAVVGAWLLVAVEQLLVQLLASAPADDLDRHVAVGIQARELDHRASQIHDPHRFAHVKHEHVRTAIAVG